MPENKVLALYDAQKNINDDAEIVYHGCVKKTDIIVKNSETGEVVFRGSNKVIIPGSGLIARKLFDINTDEVTPSYNTRLGIPNPAIPEIVEEPTAPEYIISVSDSQNSVVPTYTTEVALDGNVTVHISNDLPTGTYSVLVTSVDNVPVPGISVTVLDALGEVINVGNTSTAGKHNFNIVAFESTLSIINTETSNPVSFTTHHGQSGAVVAVLTSKIVAGTYLVTITDDSNAVIGMPIIVKDEHGFEITRVIADDSKTFSFTIEDYDYRITIDGDTTGTLDNYTYTTAFTSAGALIVKLADVTADVESAIRVDRVTPSEVEEEADIVTPINGVDIVFECDDTNVTITPASGVTSDTGVVEFTVDLEGYPVIPPIPDPDVNTNATKDNPKILLFCIGTDGCGTENSQVFPVDYKMWIKPENLIPFRYPLAVNELSDSLREMYFGRTPIGNRIAYYFKRFDAEPKFVQQFIDGTPIDGNIFDSDKLDPAESYVELILKITKDDAREWFIATTGINDAKVNTVSLCSAYPTIHEGKIYFEDIRPVTKLNFPNEALIDITKGIDIIYHIYM